jgi:hypothetical protein
VALLALMHGKNYYALGYYPVLFAFGAVWWEARLRTFRWKMVLQPALLAIPPAFLVLTLPLIYPVRSPATMAALRPKYTSLGVYRWEDGQEHTLPQDYADMLGWRELADKTWSVYQRLPDSVRAHTLIHCANYGQASAINYYNRHRAMPSAHSLNGSFLFWYPTLDQCKAIIIVDDEPDDELAPHFAFYQRSATVTDLYARERGTHITVGLQPDSSVRRLVSQEWRTELAQWEGRARESR